jgi:hypothetical protein
LTVEPAQARFVLPPQRCDRVGREPGRGIGRNTSTFTTTIIIIIIIIIITMSTTDAVIEVGRREERSRGSSACATDAWM